MFSNIKWHPLISSFVTLKKYFNTLIKCLKVGARDNLNNRLIYSELFATRSMVVP